ncbi:hypothetical protein Golax_016191, partial [Gossypium laxum]|nr:hypothetical protein [Gossypium lobatum]MBA0703898.1 hypothetical protein [Gossypium laxum]
MDPFKQFLSTEECSSAESGWTQYLVSNIEDNGEGASDDSMVSDASSGPSKHRYKHEDGECKGSHGNAHRKYGSCKEVKNEAKTSRKSKQRQRGCQLKHL